MSLAPTARLLIGGAWAQNYVRLTLTVCVIALGVALGVAVHTINHSASRELSQAVRSLAGEADISVRSGESGFDEGLYPQLAKLPGISAASPAIELTVKLTGRNERLRVIGIDPMRALVLQPALLGDATDRIIDLLREDAIMLTTSAAQQLAVAEGDRMSVQAGSRTRILEVIAILPLNDALRQPLALMDIAAAQSTFERIGQLTRVDLRVRAGHDAAAVRDRINAMLPAGVNAVEPEMTARQSLALSRAYRVNLNMLALISLFTGAVLVFSTQVLSALRRRTHFALLRALGMTQRQLASLLVIEAALIGVVGALLGIGLGLLVAHFALAYAGADLGAGFFYGVGARLSIDGLGLAVIGGAGVVAAVSGGAIPAREAARAAPAQALRAGSEQREGSRRLSVVPGVTTFVVGSGLLLFPPIAELPVFGYAAIGCYFLGAIALMPAYVRCALAVVPGTRSVPIRLAAGQMRGAPRFAGISLATMLASFSLAVAMLIMIHSFRQSLDAWLGTVLPADLYARAGQVGSAWLDTDAQERMRSLPGVQRIAFARVQTLQLDPRRPLVTLTARDLDPARPEGLPLVAPQQLPRDGSIPVWISEAIQSVHDVDVGQRFSIPLGGKRVEVTVAGIWRDYVRQGGAALINREDYVRLTGDKVANDAWIWLQPGHNAASVMQALRLALGAGTEVELREPGTLRALSLAAFDRTFAVTYALQFAALAIALFGAGLGISAQTLARRAELGTLQHIGMTRSELTRMFGIEGALLGVLGAIAGLITGILMSYVLIHVINRQSFHWSMDVHWPATALAVVSMALIASCAATAVISTRHALGMDAVRAVREDW